MEHISTISKSISAKPLFLYVINGLSMEHGTEWQSKVVDTIPSGFNAPFSFLTSVNTRCSSHIYVFLSISCEEERNVLHRIE